MSHFEPVAFGWYTHERRIQLLVISVHYLNSKSGTQGSSFFGFLKKNQGPHKINQNEPLECIAKQNFFHDFLTQSPKSNHAKFGLNRLIFIGVIGWRFKRQKYVHTPI